MAQLIKTLLLNEVELKFANSDSGTFTGYASVFNGLDSYGDTIVKGAYSDVIAQIKKGAAQMPKMFVNHDAWELPTGKWTHIEEDSKGLLVAGELTPGMTKAQDLHAAMRHGTVDGLSIGFTLGEHTMVSDGGQERRIIKTIKNLPEVSVVTFPADGKARVDMASVKSALELIESIKDFEDFLRDAGGFSKSAATALASRAKRIFAQGEPDVKQLPSDLARLIAANLQSARTL